VSIAYKPTFSYHTGKRIVVREYLYDTCVYSRPAGRRGRRYCFLSRQYTNGPTVIPSWLPVYIYILRSSGQQWSPAEEERRYNTRVTETLDAQSMDLIRT